MAYSSGGAYGNPFDDIPASAAGGSNSAFIDESSRAAYDMGPAYGSAYGASPPAAPRAPAPPSRSVNMGAWGDEPLTSEGEDFPPAQSRSSSASSPSSRQQQQQRSKEREQQQREWERLERERIREEEEAAAAREAARKAAAARRAERQRVRAELLGRGPSTAGAWAGAGVETGPIEG